MTAKAMPTIRCQDGGSRKNKMPATAMIAAPPARMAGTEDSGPPFWKSRKKAIVPAPTQMPVSSGIIETGSTEFLSPSSRKPENRQIDHDRQCGAGFDNETTETLTNALGSETCENLMRAVKHSGDDRIPEPSCHETNLVYEMDHSREN